MVDSRADLSTNWYQTHALHIQPCVYNGTVAQEACFGRYWYFQYAVPKGDSIYVTPVGSRTFNESSWVVGGNPDATAVFTAGGAINGVGSISNLTLNADGTPASGHTAAIVGGTQRGLLYSTGQGAAAGSGSSASAAVSGSAVRGAGVSAASGQGVTGAALTVASGPGGVSGAAGVAAAGAGTAVSGVTRTAGGPAGLPTLSISALAGLYKVPTGGLWVMNSSPGAHHLVGLNSAFGSSNGVSSDQYLQALGYDPAKVEERLGDGAYEQQLVQQQLLGLTGKSVLSGYADQSSEYAALLDAGAAYARQFGLAPGVGLTAEQMAALTSDMVLLVDTVVQTPSGPQHVLAPQLYLTAADAKDLSTTGSLIAAATLNLNAGSGSVVNTGTLLATNSAQIQAADILNGGFINGGRQTLLTASNGLTNTGAITGQAVGLTAGTLDLVKGGQVNAQDLSLYSASSLTLSQTSGLNVTHNLQAAAGGDLTLDALKLNLAGSAAFAAGGNLTLAAETNATGLNLAGSNMAFQSQTVSHDLTSISALGNVSFSAGGDLVSQAAQVKAGGLLTAVAGGNIQLQSVTDSQSVNWSVKEGSRGTTVATYAEQVQGSSFSGAGGVGLVAGVTSPAGSIAINASNVTSANGAVTLAASGNVSIASGTQETDSSVQTYSKKNGFLSSSSRSTNDVSDVTGVVASTVSGETVQVAAGGDISVLGSNVASTLGTSLSAGGNITIAAATASDHEEHDVTTKQSGVFGSGGASLTIGGQKTSTTDVSDQTTAVGALVGATNGNVSLAAGKDVTITGSQVVAAGLGGVSIQGQNVTIQAAEQTSTETSTYKHSQSGLTLAVSSPLISAAQTIGSVASAAADSGDARVQALAAGTAGLAAYNAYDAVVNDPKGPADMGGFSISASIGSSSVKSTETRTSTTWLGSQIQGGSGGVTVVATGAGAGSTLKVVGSSISSPGDITLASSGAIDLEAAQDTTSQTGKNSNSGWSLGGSFGTQGFGVSVSASEASGRQNGSSLTNVNTQIAAGGAATLISGGDTTLKGADVAGNTVVADIGGNLLIQSLQDTSTFKSQNQSAGFGLSWSQLGGVSAQLNLSSGKENSTYASVTDQSGIRAGSGGFDITVAGNTNLIGGLIASTAPAAANSLTTGTLTYSDIENQARYDASQTSIGLGWSAKGGNQTNGQGKVIPAGGGFQLGSLGGFSATPPSALSANGSESSTTKSAVSAGTITITDAAGQAALTGQSPDQAIAGLSRDTGADTTGALKTIFDQQKIQDAFTVTQAFQQQVGVLVTDKINQATALKSKIDQGKASQDEIDQYNSLQANWGPGGTYRQIVTALSAGAGGNVTGGMGQFAQAATVAYLQELGATSVKQIADSLKLDGAETPQSEAVRTALQAIVGCAGATAANQACSNGATGAAASVVINDLLDTVAKPAADETESEKNARLGLVTSVITGIASTGDAAVMAAAAQIEAENNALRRPPGVLTDLPKNLPGTLDRSSAYKVMGMSLSDDQAKQKTAFFGAASTVTSMAGLGGAEVLSEFGIGELIPGVGYSGNVEAILYKIGGDLYSQVNLPTYHNLYNGTGPMAGLSGANLDNALVHQEQSFVQSELNALPYADRLAVIQQSSAIMNGPLVRLNPPMAAAIQSLGHSFDYGNQADREAVGRYLVQAATLKR